MSVSPLRHKIIPLVYPAPSNYHTILYIMLHVYSPDYSPHRKGREVAAAEGQAGMEFTNTEGRGRSVPAVEQQTGLD